MTWLTRLLRGLEVRESRVLLQCEGAERQRSVQVRGRGVGAGVAEGQVGAWGAGAGLLLGTRVGCNGGHDWAGTCSVYRVRQRLWSVVVLIASHPLRCWSGEIPYLIDFPFAIVSSVRVATVRTSSARSGGCVASGCVLSRWRRRHAGIGVETRGQRCFRTVIVLVSR